MESCFGIEKWGFRRPSRPSPPPWGGCRRTDPASGDGVAPRDEQVGQSEQHGDALCVFRQPPVADVAMGRFYRARTGQHAPLALWAGVPEPQRVRTPRGRGTPVRHRGSLRTNQPRTLPDRSAGDPQPPSGGTPNTALRERFHSIGYRSPPDRWRQPSTVHRIGVGPVFHMNGVCQPLDISPKSFANFLASGV